MIFCPKDFLFLNFIIIIIIRRQSDGTESNVRYFLDCRLLEDVNAGEGVARNRAEDIKKIKRDRVKAPAWVVTRLNDKDFIYTYILYILTYICVYMKKKNLNF